MRWHAPVRTWALPAFVFFASADCSSYYNTVRLYSKKNPAAQYRQLVTDHYLYVDDNHVKEYERGDRRATIILRSRQNGRAELFLKLRTYPDDALRGDALQFAWNDGETTVSMQLLKELAEEEDVTVLETGENVRTNPTIGNDVQAQSGYITFGKPTGAGSARRHWLVFQYAANISERDLANIVAHDTWKIQVRGGPRLPVIDFSDGQVAAWRRFSAGQWDEESKD